MIIIKNGIKSTLRAKGRSTLFVILIAVVAIALILSVSIRLYCQNMLAECDNHYTSILQFEYIGANYPDRDIADSQSQSAYKKLAQERNTYEKNVKYFELSQTGLGNIVGFVQVDDNKPYPDCCVLTVSGFTPVYHHGSTPIAKSDIPTQHICFNTTTMASTYTLNDKDSFELPTVYNDRETGEYWTPIYANGRSDIRYLSESDLPSTYVLRDVNSSNYTLVGQIPLRYLRISDKNFYSYDPISDSYSTEAEILYGYYTTVTDIFYASDLQVGTILLLTTSDGFLPEKEDSYLIHGLYNKKSGEFSLSNFYEGCVEAPYLKLPSQENIANAPDIFFKYAEKYQAGNSYVRIEVSHDISTLEPFHQSYLYLEQGRFPKSSEENSCVIDGYMATQLGVSLGNNILLTAGHSNGTDRFDLTLAGDVKEYTIVGITNSSKDYLGCVWLTNSDALPSSEFYGYMLARAQVENEQGPELCEAIQKCVPNQVRVTLYDQGYSAITEPLQKLDTIALYVQILSIASGMVVIILLGYLFVGRQQKSVELLRDLGVTKIQTSLWLLSGGTAISIIGLAFAGVFSKILMRRSISALFDIVRQSVQRDLRYSEEKLSIAIEPPPAYSPPSWIEASIILTLFLAIMVSLFAFLYRVLHGTMSQKKTASYIKRHLKSTRTCTTGKGVLRYAVLSAKRGGLRSLLVITVSLVLSLTLAVMGTSANDISRQRETFLRNSEITGQVITQSGHSCAGITLGAQYARLLWNSEMLSNLNVSIRWHYWQEENLPIFKSESEKDSWISQQPCLIATNSLSATQEFYYGDSRNVTYLPNWDDSFLAQEQDSTILALRANHTSLTYPAIASDHFLREKGLTLGDHVPVVIRIPCNNSNIDLDVNLLLVGTFHGQQSQNIYVPLGFWFSPDWLIGSRDVVSNARRPNIMSRPQDWNEYIIATTLFDTCRFTLSSAKDIKDFRQYLDQNDFSEVGIPRSNRTTVQLKDSLFSEMDTELTRYLTLMRVLIPALMFVFALVSFVISLIVVNHRKDEFRLLREIGIARCQVFHLFFIEQFILNLCGSIGGTFIIWIVNTVNGRSFTTVWLIMIGFVLCYAIGSSIAIAISSDRRV